jgi:hypothetical protein
MKRLFFAAIVLLSACTMNMQTNKQISDTIKSELKPQSVDIMDGAEANVGGFNGSKKEITLAYTTHAPSGKLELLNAGYRSANTAYKLAQAAHDKLPDVFRIVIKSGANVAATLDYKSAYLPKNKVYEQQVTRFLAVVKSKQYQNLQPLMEPGLDIGSIINVFQRADATIGGVQAYQLVALQHTKGTRKADGKPIDIIQAWAVIRGSSKSDQGVMLFVFKPDAAVISSVYINPKDDK